MPVLIGACSVRGNIDNVTPVEQTNRFVATGVYYYINERKYDVIKDTETNNLYLSSHTGAHWGPDLAPLYDGDSHIMKE
jgi:hypothetical protein